MEEAEFFQTPSNGVITLKIKILRYGVHAITALNFSDNMSKSGGTVEILGQEQRGQMNVSTYYYDYRNVLMKLRKDIKNTAYADESGRQLPFSSARGSLQTALQSTLDDLCHFVDEALME